MKTYSVLLSLVIITVVASFNLVSSGIKAQTVNDKFVNQLAVDNVVLDLGRISRYESFNYTSAQFGSYDLVFTNEFDNFSLVVLYNISWPKGNLSSLMEIPFNETRFITVDLDNNQTVRGNFSITGGEKYNDIHFFIRLTLPTIPEFQPWILPILLGIITLITFLARAFPKETQCRVRAR